MVRKVLIAFLLIFLAEHGISQANKKQWVDSVYNTLTFDQRLGQLFIMPAYPGSNDRHESAILNTISRFSLGGVQILTGNAEGVAEFNAQLASTSELPLLSMVNITRGLQTSISDIPNTPSIETLAALASDSMKVSLAQMVEKQLSLLGTNVAMINWTNPPQGHLQAESLEWFKHLKSREITMAMSAFNNENNLQEKDVLSSILKSINTEAEIITIDNMTTSLDTKNPASLSKKTIIHLRDKIGYQGVILADELESLKKYKPGKTEAMALSSGCDLIVSTNIDLCIKQIKRYIKKREITLANIEQSTKKILGLKFDLLRSKNESENTRLIARKLNNPSDQLLLESIYEKSVSTLNPNNILPIKELEDISFATYNTDLHSNFQKRLEAYAPFTHYPSYTPTDKLREVLPLFDYVIVAVDTSSISIDKIEVLNSLGNKVIICSLNGLAPTVAFNNQFSKVISYEANIYNEESMAELIFGATTSDGVLPKEAMPIDFISNQNMVPKNYRLGFDSPENVGMNGAILSKINNIVTDAIKDEATPGGQVIVARKGKVVFNQSFGYHTYDSLKLVTDQSIYDIASITKVAATTQAVMFLTERKAIDLDKKMSFYLEDLKGTNKENMTIRDILTHQAGLWPYLPFWKETLTDDTFSSVYYSFNEDDDFPYELSEGIYVSNITRDSVWNWVKHSKLRTKKYRETYDYKYSDMGYYMLQRLIEKLVNQPMAEFLQQNFYDPLGLTTMSYLPLCKFPQDVIAPTEDDQYFRQSLIKGWVHDQGAAMMGGVAGHAGLFSNALDLAKLLQMLLWHGQYGGNRYFKEETIEEFISVQYASNRRGIGWDKPVVAEWNSPTSAYASKKSFGHTGFTGTAVWADPEFDLIYVFLSNRIYPDATNRKLIKDNIRTRIQDLVYESIFSYSATNDLSN